jgi:acetyl-CoA carboxylase biotin carboxylase subunit
MRKLLVANRGEIALRVMRTARAMGIATVAVYSDADADAPFVRFADEAVRIGPPPARESYLVINNILDAARRTGAQAIHPGYGFLSENARFAEAVAEAGLIFIGPPADVIGKLGSKQMAKDIAMAANVPVVPGYNGRDQSTDVLVREAQRIGFPVLVKASAGGGGRGMRVVESADDLDGAVASASREAMSAFSDGTVFLERYVQRPRHVEIQLLADMHGTVVSLFERECSVQRRHQKVIEEAPSPVVDDDLRARMGAAAVAAAQAVGYVGAGTVEFVLDANGGDDDGTFAFLEMNTRLQVEHPVTELVTGLDLVRLQLLVAMGRPLPAEVSKPRITGHAVEARLYAEDPTKGYLPQTGTLRTMQIPDHVGVRVDSGVRDGSVVSHHYDAMLAKVIAWAPTRAEALGALSAALAGARIHGLTTNRDLLVRVLRHDEFAGRGTDTGFLDRHDVADLGAALIDRDGEGLHAIAATLAQVAGRRAAAPVQPTLPAGWRNNPSQLQSTGWLTADGRERRVGYALLRDGVEVEVDGKPVEDVSVLVQRPDRVVLETGGVRRGYDVVLDADIAYVDSPAGSTAFTQVPRFLDPSALKPAGSLTAPMPGSVIRLPVAAGDVVTAGQALVVVEAMKMEHTIVSPIDGIVAELSVEVGQQVSTGDALAVVGAAAGADQD